MAPGIPQIEDKRPRFLRVLPKNTQSRILAAIALVMVVIMVFSNRQPSPPHSAPPPAAASVATDPNLARIQEYRRDIDEQARKLAEEEARLVKTKQSFEAQGRDGERPPGGPSPSGMPASVIEPHPSEIETERAKRDYQSLFAANLVVSYRSPTTVAPASESPAKKETPAVDSPEKSESGAKQYRILEGTIVETVLTNRLDSTFSGPVNCMVTTNVYSEDRQTLLIPQGSRVLGEVRRLESMGEQRLAVFFHRIILPNGRSVNLDRFQGLNQIGETGLRDLINHHYVQIFGVSIALGAIAGLAQANTRYSLDESAAQAYEQGVSSSLSQSATHILDRYLNVLPTFTIREGQRVKIYFSQDLTLPAYRPLNL